MTKRKPSKPPFMPVFVGDYLRDTYHLDRAQHGSYLLLLMAMWAANGKLPSDDRKLARLALCSDAEWADLKPVIIGFFKKRGGHLRHGRLDAELAVYHDGVEQRRNAGLASASKKANENNAKRGTGVAIPLNEKSTNHNHNHSKGEGLIESPSPLRRDAPLLPNEGKAKPAREKTDEDKAAVRAMAASFGRPRRRR